MDRDQLHTSAEVQSEVRFSADKIAPLHELIRAKLVALRLGPPGELWSLRALVFRSNAVDPMVCCDKVASRIAHDWHVELFERIDHVFAEAVLVDQVFVRVLRVVQAAVDASSHVLSETAIYVVVDLAELVGGEDGDGGLLAGFELCESRHVD